MSGVELGLIIIGASIAMILARVPIAVAMFLGGAGGFAYIVGFAPLFNWMKGVAYARLASFDLIVWQRLATGVIGLGLLLSAEVSMVWLQGLTLAQWLAARDPVSGAVYGAMLVLFALLPWLVARR